MRKNKDPPPPEAQHALSVHFQKEHITLRHATNHENSEVNTVNRMDEKKISGVDLVLTIKRKGKNVNQWKSKGVNQVILRLL